MQRKESQEGWQGRENTGSNTEIFFKKHFSPEHLKIVASCFVLCKH